MAPPGLDAAKFELRHFAISVVVVFVVLVVVVVGTVVASGRTASAAALKPRYYSPARRRTGVED